MISLQTTGNMLTGYLARQLFGLSLAHTATVSLAGPALSGSKKAQLAIGVIQTYNWGGFSALCSIGVCTWKAITWTKQTLDTVSNWASTQDNVFINTVATLALGTLLYKAHNPTSSFNHNFINRAQFLWQHAPQFSLKDPLGWARRMKIHLHCLPIFHKPTLPSALTAILEKAQLDNRLKASLELLFSPVAEALHSCHDAMQSAISDPLVANKRISKLCAFTNIDPALVIRGHSALSSAEALLNWGGKIPFISYLSGSIRFYLGLTTAAVSTIAGSVLIMASFVNKHSVYEKTGKMIIREYAVLHGGSNMLRGLFECYAWSVSLMATLVWDLSGKRFCYLGETPSPYHLPLAIR